MFNIQKSKCSKCEGADSCIAIQESEIKFKDHKIWILEQKIKLLTDINEYKKLKRIFNNMYKIWERNI